MPEGHSIHRLAGQFRVLLGGQVLSASSPQGRFAAGATRLDGQRLVAVRVHGKHLFLGFAPADLKVASVVVVTEGGSRGAISEDALTWLHVHLGIYGSWRFTGDAVFHEPLHWLLPESENQEDSRTDIEAQQTSHDAKPGSGLDTDAELGSGLDTDAELGSGLDTDAELGSGLDTDAELGSSLDTDAELGSGLEVTLVDSGENVTIREIPAHTRADGSAFAPHEHFADRWFLMPGQFRVFAPVGTVRLRLMNPHGVADLSGPNRCELLDWAQTQAIAARLGPDPLRPDAQFADFVARAATRKKGIGESLMDQNVIAGVGNIYRAEALFAARLSPFVPAREVSERKLRRVWDWLVEYMARGVESGRVTTLAPRDAADFATCQAGAGGKIQAVDQRYYVYQRDGRPCVRCGATVRLAVVGGRKLYWCPRCQR